MRKNHVEAGNGHGYLPFALDLLSFLFILSAPYLIFIDHTDFIFEVVNLFFVVAFAAIAAGLSVVLRLVPSIPLRVLILTILLLLFIDIQFDWLKGAGEKGMVATGVTLFIILWILRRHVSQIIGVVFGTIIVVTLGTSLLSDLLENNFAASAGSDNHKTRLPIYVHIILDEQIGIEGFDAGIPTHVMIRREIETFFVENKFRIYSRAYSPYYDSRDSISSALNLKVTKNTEQLYSGERPYVLSKNLYFENLSRIGYDINVYQSTYMDFCSSVRIRIRKCVTYKHNAISSAALTGLTGYEKAVLVFAQYSELSYFLKRTQKYWNKWNSYLRGLGIILPDWRDATFRVGPIAALPVFDTLIKDVSAAQRGSMFFAHLLIPHYPYSVDSACAIRRPIMKWNNRNSGINDADRVNAARSRLARYEEYIPQVRCGLLKLERLLDGLKTSGNFEDAIIIVHGDHGSRIVLVEPRIENQDRLSGQDFYDAFSTLYVVKLSGILPGYDTRMVALAELIQNTVSGDINASAKSEADTRLTVFLRDPGKPGLQEIPMPYLPVTNR